MANAFLWLLSIVLGIVLTIVLQEPIQDIVVRIGGGLFRTERSIKGLWEIRSVMYNDDENVERNHLVELRQFGKSFSYRNVIEKKRPESNWYEWKFIAKGRIYSDRFASAIWKSTVERSIYHGAMTISFHPNGKSFNGKVLGINSDGGVNIGDIHGVIVSKKIDKKSKATTIKAIQKKWSVERDDIE